jgi:hypothetical protein
MTNLPQDVVAALNASRCEWIEGPEVGDPARPGKKKATGSLGKLVDPQAFETYVGGMLRRATILRDRCDEATQFLTSKLKVAIEKTEAAGKLKASSEKGLSKTDKATENGNISGNSSWRPAPDVDAAKTVLLRASDRPLTLIKYIHSLVHKAFVKDQRAELEKNRAGWEKESNLLGKRFGNKWNQVAGRYRGNDDKPNKFTGKRASDKIDFSSLKKPSE